MKLNILAKGFDLVSGTHDALEAELTSLNKTLGVDNDYQVKIRKKIYGEYECAISTYLNGKNYNVVVTRKGLKYAIEAAIKSIKSLILTDKSKVVSKKMGEIHSVGTKSKAKEDKAPKTRITKTKNVDLTPMSVDEAIDNLVDSHFDMYLFLNEETLEVNGVYYRVDGFGLINFNRM